MMVFDRQQRLQSLFIGLKGSYSSTSEIEINELNIVRARQEFVNNDNITYQELDRIDNPDACKPNDIAEIFIRANSGGTKLNKSDLLFSLLSMHTYDFHHPILAVAQKSCSLVFLCHLERKQRDHFLSLTPPPRG